MNKSRLLVLMLAGLLAACGTTAKKEQSAASVQEQSSGAAKQSNGSAQTYGAGAENANGMEELNNPKGPLSVRTIYFDFDSSDIKDKYQAVIEAHAAFLAAHPKVTVLLEGNTDERGSREYNLALGERRAEAVKRQMVVLGAAASQIRTTSYGEERPVALGHDEAAWAKNRRVDIVYGAGQ